MNEINWLKMVRMCLRNAGSHLPGLWFGLNEVLPSTYVDLPGGKRTRVGKLRCFCPLMHQKVNNAHSLLKKKKKNVIPAPHTVMFLLQ